MRDHPLATLVTWQHGGADADHLPLMFDPAANVLRGHVARANPLWQVAGGQRVLAVFQGPQAYVTPSWYATKAQTHQVVPTWNYGVVHAHGVLRVVDDAPWLHALVTQLTVRQEAERDNPWAVGDAPHAYVQQMLHAIVGIEIAVTELIGKWKLSQNRNAADHAGVVAGLKADGHRDMAALMDASAGAGQPQRDG